LIYGGFLKMKKMLGDTIYRLRKEKGLSQAELGDLVGVSNKAVSKWETYEANPDISSLSLLAKALGVSIEELLTDVKPEKTPNETSDEKLNETCKGEAMHEDAYKEANVFGLLGVEIDTLEKYEFCSNKKTKKGLSYLHIHIGKTSKTVNAKARGVIAIGGNAKGLISIGLVSQGLLSIGLASIELLSFGVVSMGLLAVGAVAAGGAALGAIAVGIVSLGAISVGVVSVGAVSLGVWSYTG
jgi:transcriptional regulator with XRE-family HTH domain